MLAERLGFRRNTRIWVSRGKPENGDERRDWHIKRGDKAMSIKTIGPWIIVKKSEFPHFQKAHRIARELTEQHLEDILEHRYHLHRNPVKRKPPVPYPGEEGVYPKSGE